MPPTPTHDSPSFDLQRFVLAQDEDGTYDRALKELTRGRKTTHWMWFVFPQVSGLGKNPMAVRYAITSRAEAEAYLAHPVLGPRLLQCAAAVLDVHGRTAVEIFGETDTMKLKSSATLFANVSPPGSPFHRILEQYHDGDPDAKTLTFLQQGS